MIPLRLSRRVLRLRLCLCFCLLLPACDVAYAPSITNLNVDCSSSATDGNWSMSCDAMDEDGAADILEVEVELVDFDGATVQLIPLEYAAGTRWSIELPAEQVKVACKDKPLYLFRFSAVDQSGLEGSASYYP